MPSVVIKADRGRDLYVIWSTVTDGPMVTGTRDEVAEALSSGRYGEGVEDRLQRADETGSSAIRPWRIGHWGDGGLMVNWDHRGDVEIGRRVLPREHLAEWLTTGDESLTRPVFDLSDVASSAPGTVVLTDAARAALDDLPNGSIGGVQRPDDDDLA